MQYHCLFILLGVPLLLVQWQLPHVSAEQHIYSPGNKVLVGQVCQVASNFLESFEVDVLILEKHRVYCFEKDLISIDVQTFIHGYISCFQESIG